MFDFKSIIEISISSLIVLFVYPNLDLKTNPEYTLLYRWSIMNSWFCTSREFRENRATAFFWLFLSSFCFLGVLPRWCQWWVMRKQLWCVLPRPTTTTTKINTRIGNCFEAPNMLVNLTSSAECSVNSAYRRSVPSQHHLESRKCLVQWWPVGWTGLCAGSCLGFACDLAASLASRLKVCLI